jgi:hypothetical protein
MKKIKIGFILVLVSLLMFSTSCEEVMSSSDYEAQIQKAYEYFALPEFPNMELIEVTKHLFFPVYIVSTPEEFNNIRKYKDRSYFINNDIDLSSIENFEPIGSEDDPFVGEISSSCIIASKGSMGTINKGFRGCRDVYNDQYNNYRVISNIKINITYENYTKYVGVIGYAAESNVDYFIEAQKVLNPGYMSGTQIESMSFLRNTTNGLIFDNVNIEVNSIKETVVGGVFGKGGKTNKTFIVNSRIKGNYIVGSYMGINEKNPFDNRLTYLSYMNEVIIEPIKDGGLIGGVYGVLSTDLRDYKDEFYNYNNIEIIENEFSNNVIVGGIAGNAYIDRVAKNAGTMDPCKTVNYKGVTFTKFTTGNANTNLLFGNVQVINSYNYEYCSVENENYNNVFILDNHYTTEDNVNIKFISSLKQINGEEIILTNNKPHTISLTLEEMRNFIDKDRFDIFMIESYDYPIIIELDKGSVESEKLQRILSKTYFETSKLMNI